MKSKILYAASVAIVLASCSKESVPDNPASDGELVNLEINLTGAVTKAANTHESDINTLQLFVFGTNRKLEATKRFTAGQPFSIGVMRGQKIVHAIVNAPEEITGIINYSDISKMVSDLKDNTRGSFVMEGCNTANITSSSSSVTIEAKRLVSKVSLVKVENQLAGAYEGKPLTVKSVRLINVAADRAYQADGSTPAAPKKWYNKMDYVSADPVGGLTYATYDDVVTSKGSKTYQEDFYGYPNPTTQDASGGEWTDRCTRLVVEVELDNATFFYPVTLPEMEQNTCYDIGLTITRPGSSDPDIPCNTYNSVATITVKPWTTGTAINERI